ncbi:hypothetical protein NE237_027037 [Protea cynaroides]|uniref:Uncharacterized protein n=1 Tax=Protea cynaroides TaxID=273540 RepID=A0A9Q0GMM3_9MAGN|nr:hypothetical protein NE237_027037 [Protea cynaroides]
MQTWIIKQLWQEKQLYCYACQISLCSIIFHISDPWHSNHQINFLQLKLDVCDPTEVFAPANVFQLVLCERSFSIGSMSSGVSDWKSVFWRMPRIRYLAASFFPQTKEDFVT